MDFSTILPHAHTLFTSQTDNHCAHDKAIYNIYDLVYLFYHYCCSPILDLLLLILSVYPAPPNNGYVDFTNIRYGIHPFWIRHNSDINTFTLYTG